MSSSVIACIAVVVLSSGAGDAKIGFPDTEGFPRVVLTPEELPALRARSWEAWALPIRERILREADALVEEPLDIPHAEGQWTHWYSCTNDAARLRPLDPQRHICPQCGTVYTGYPYDDVYVAMRHNHWLNGVATLGMAYALRPERRYAARVRDILLEYASFYTDLRLHNKYEQNSPSKARLFAQTLDEAVALCNVVLGYDLVYDSPAFSRIDHGVINRQFIRQMVKTVRGNDAGISNWQSWHNAAIAMAGCLLRDESMVALALHGKSGFHYQMRRSLMATGMWYEESPVYHWYALRAHVYLLEAVTRAGIPLYEHPKVRGMFDAPLRILLPDGTMPPLNDSDRASIDSQSAFYDIAFNRYGDAAYARWLHPRNSDWALLWGASTVPDPGPPPPAESTNSASEGLAILRNLDNTIVAMLEYGPALSGHAHPAKLNVLLYGLNEILLVDPGRISYGNPLHDEWYKQTLAHNTVVVNSASQARTGGRLRAFSSDPPLIRAFCDTAYPDVTLDRTLLLHENLVIDVVQCRAKRSATFDLPFHVNGDILGLAPGTPIESLGKSAGYQHLEAVERLESTPRSIDIAPPSGGVLRLHLADGGVTYRAAGRGNPANERVPVIIQRKEGPTVVFASAYEILAEGIAARDAMVEVTEQEGGCAITFGDVRLDLGDDTVVVLPSGRTRVGVLGPVPAE